MRILKTTDTNVIKIDSETSVILTSTEMNVLEALFPTRLVQAKEIIKEGVEEKLRAQRMDARREMKKEKRAYGRAATEYNGPPLYEAPVSVDD